MLDIIPDIHGQSATLRSALERLGYRERDGVYRHGEPDRRVLFLGDFIDRGPDNRGTLAIVRAMVEGGSALAIMGNHELNAIHFHTTGRDGSSLRSREGHNADQHASFLREFPIGAPDTGDAIEWMKTLPLFEEVEGCRAVHACWDDAAIDRLRDELDGGRLSEELVRETAKGGRLYEDVETVLKGKEKRLPGGRSFFDKGGKERHHVRLRWWGEASSSWRDAAVSVPDPKALPDEVPPAIERYSADAPPVFFGHYWLEGEPVIEAPNAACLDYSVGKGGDLVSYRWDGQTPLSSAALSIHPHVAMAVVG